MTAVQVKNQSIPTPELCMFPLDYRTTYPALGITLQLLTSYMQFFHL